MKNYIKPYEKEYSIYIISNCKYCKLIKENIKSKKKIINCDKYVETLRERDNFYNFIQKYTKIPYKYFPMIFKNGEFIGGYKEFLDFNLKTNHQ